MPGIDYSKWDKLHYSSSSATDSDVGSGDDEEEERRHGGLRVTRLEYPSRVTLGPNGVQLEQAPPRASVSPFASAPASSRAAAVSSASAPPRGATTSPLQPTPPSSTTPPCHSARASGGVGSSTGASFLQSANTATGSAPSKLDARGGAAAATLAEDNEEDDEEDLLYECLARNGGREGAQQWWAQTEDTVTVTFVVPWETTSKSVTEFRVYGAPDGTQAGEGGGMYRAQLTCTIHAPPPHASAAAVTASTPFHVHRVFRYPVKLNDDLLEGCWQLHRMPRRHLRLLVVQLFKEPIGLGMTLWWDRCFTTDTLSVIHDTQAIPDRLRHREATPGSQEKAEQFRKVWAEAHEEYRRRLQERKRKGGHAQLE